MRINLLFFQNSIVVFFLYLSFNFYLRYFTLHYSTIDWDEITYFIIGKGILEGKIPYIELWDLKPVGSYLIYGFFISIFGYSTETIRIVTWIFSSSLALGTFLHLKEKNFWIGFLSGLFSLYLFILFPAGLSGNTEVLFTPIQVFALYFILKDNLVQNAFGFFLLGFSFIVKYIIVFDVIWFFIFYFFFKNRFQKDDSPAIKKIFISAFFFLLPFLVVVFFYLYKGHFTEFWDVTFGVAKKHKKAWNFNAILEFFWNLGNIFFIIYLVFISLLFWTKQKFSEILIYLGWMITSGLGAIWTGFLYDHYLLACLPSWILVMGKLGISAWNGFQNKEKSLKLVGAVLLILIVGISVQRKNQLQKILSKIPDEQKELAQFLQKENVQNFFVAYGYHTTYILQNSFPPIKLVQPNNYTEEIFAKNFSVNINQIFSDLSNQNVNYIQWCGEISPLEIKEDYAKQKGIHFEYILGLQNYLKDFALVFELQSCKVYKK